MKSAVHDALENHSEFNPSVVRILLALTMYCMENVITQYQTEFFMQEHGIVTGDNHSVSIANMAVHYIVKTAHSTVNKSKLFVRFIDDILWISEGLEDTAAIEQALLKCFGDFGLRLTFRYLNNSSENQLEFLDVLHVSNATARIGFVTKDFQKPTATYRCFLNGASHHPPHVFRSIVYGESIRMRRLKERDQDYLESLERLQKKCMVSGFDEKMTTYMIDLAKTWTSRFGPTNLRPESSSNAERLTWATSYPQSLRLSRKEKQLQPAASITYKRPPTLGVFLTNYRKLAFHQSNNQTQGISQPCGHCSLCGKHGRHKSSMVATARQIQSKRGNFSLRQRLSCTNYGVYVATCCICHEQYVGQTKNRFSVRWTAHRNSWKTFDISAKGDKAALLKHYDLCHPLILIEKPELSECFTVTFAEQPSVLHLDQCEDKWAALLGASINVKKMISPRV